MERRFVLTLLCALVSACGARTGLEPNEPDAAPDAAPDAGCVEDAECDDSLFCTGPERCISGSCEPGLPPDCLDGDLCTEDTCDPKLDECVYVSRRVDADGDTFFPIPCGPDCDDENALVHPGAEEQCNGIDDDCDLLVDEDLLYTPTRVDTRLTEDVFASSAAGLAWVDDHYVASYWDNRNLQPSVYLSLLTETGERIEDDKNLSAHPGDAYGAGLAWSGRVVGTVWEDRRDGDFEIYYQRLNSDAEKLQPDLRVTNARDFSLNPSIVWSGRDFAITWQDSRYREVEDDNDEVFFQRIEEDGELLGPEVQLTSSLTPSLAPSITSDDRGDEYAVAWVELVTGTNYEIFFTTVSRDGEIAAPQPVTQSGDESTTPSIVWGGTEYAVVWEENRGSCDGPGTGMAGSCFARVSSEGEVLQIRRLDDGSSHARFPALYWTGGAYIGLWSDFRHGQFELYYSVLAADGETLVADTRITEAEGDSFGGALAPAAGDLGVLFTDTRDGNREVYFTSLGCRGGGIHE